jgi:hypothetical protein
MNATNLMLVNGPGPEPEFRPAQYFRSELTERLLIDADTLCRCLKRRGWRRHREMYARVDGKLLFQGDRGDIIRDLSFLLEREGQDFSHAVMKNLQQLTTPTALELLPELAEDILRDDRETIRLPFRNGVLCISRNGRELLPYSAFDQLVWSHKVIDRDFTELPQEQYLQAPWYKFLQYVCTRPKPVSREDSLDSRVESLDCERFTALQATLGKLLHTYNNPSKPVAVIFTDETGWEDENTGGTGKSLLAESVKHLRKGITIQCRDKKKGDAFFFDSVSGDIDLLILDDLDSAVMAFSQLYGYLTGGLEVNRKGEHHFKYSMEDNPRFVITTNQAIKGSDISDVRRRWDMQLLPFFDLKIQPRDINSGNNFFEEWTPADWLCFDNIMAECCSTYFRTDSADAGCPPYSSNAGERSIRQEIGNEIVDWLDCWKSDLEANAVHEAVEPLIGFRERYNDETNSKVVKNFTRMLKKWGQLRNISVEINKERYCGKSQNIIRMSWII